MGQDLHHIVREEQRLDGARWTRIVPLLERLCDASGFVKTRRGLWAAPRCDMTHGEEMSLEECITRIVAEKDAAAAAQKADEWP